MTNIPVGTTATQIFAYDGTRLSGLCQNAGTAPVFVGADTTVTPSGGGNPGISVAVGATFVTDKAPAAALFGIVTVGTDTMTCMEELR